MKIWNPLVTTLAISFVVNAFPFVMAFVLRVDGWAQTGWIWYFYTIPGALILTAIGLFLSLRRRGQAVRKDEG